MRSLKTFSKEERGASLVAYALIVALLAIVAIPSMITVSDEVNDTFCVVAGSLKDEQLVMWEFNNKLKQCMLVCQQPFSC
ncbi:Flp family type IVb pilin [Oligoflexia bacterium]|nr:Flp family type IVb pilin [Oligoflexia bacterium]